jgi:ArsR family transcriptional regulator, virulence genes transcriptional regulator
MDTLIEQKPLAGLGAAQELEQLEARAGEARLLKLLSNERRLLLLCRLVGGEATVNALADAVGLSQSALSQHLAKLREDGLVAYRREGTTLYYRISDRHAERVLELLKDMYCSADCG